MLTAYIVVSVLVALLGGYFVVGMTPTRIYTVKGLVAFLVIATLLVVGWPLLVLWFLYAAIANNLK